MLVVWWRRYNDGDGIAVRGGVPVPLRGIIIINKQTVGR
jgi:hypothetical protein